MSQRTHDELVCRIEQLEREAAIKDAYAYELAKQRDLAQTQLSDAAEALSQIYTVSGGDCCYGGSCLSGQIEQLAKTALDAIQQ